MEIVWNAPGPGFWELDLSHFRGGTTPILQELATGAMADGMRRIMRDLGAPVDTLQPAFVNGFCYTRLRPLIGADRPSKKLPPLPILRLATRLHPEMRRRARTADRVIADRPWRAVIADWERDGRATIERQNLALQDVDLGRLDDQALIRHVVAVHAHCRKNWEHHFWLHGYDLGPIGFLLVCCAGWGVDAETVIALLEGASPSTTDPLVALARIRAAVEASGRDVVTLDEVLSTSSSVADDLDTYLRSRGSLLFSRYDLDGVTLGERPELILATIMQSRDRDHVSSIDRQTAAVRETVPVASREEFDERLAEARAAMNLRDDNGPTTAEWPLGLLRLALLEVGRRMVASGLATDAALALEVRSDEIAPSLLTGDGPSGDTLAARSAARARCSRLHPPTTLGTVEVAPPVSVLPQGMARLVTAIQIVMEQMGMAGDRDSFGAGLRGTGIGRSSYRGVARRAASPEEALDSMEPGDVLIVPFTTPAYNVVLSIAGAIVTAVGGPLSHAAVLARELGIPAVIGASAALVEIDDGDIVEVDPIAGEVRLVERLDKSAR